mgnify:CR=1 FL=1
MLPDVARLSAIATLRLLPILGLAAASPLVAKDPPSLVGTWYFTAFEQETEAPKKKITTTQLSSYHTVDVTEATPGVLSFKFRNSSGMEVETFNTIYSVADDAYPSYKMSAIDPIQEGWEIHSKHGFRVIRDDLVLMHHLGGELLRKKLDENSDDTTTLAENSWGISGVLTKSPLPQPNAAYWAGPYEGTFWLYGLDHQNDQRLVSQEFGSVSFNLAKSGSSYRFRLTAGDEVETGTAKASGKHLAFSYSQSDKAGWTDAYSTGKIEKSQSSNRIIQVSDHEIVVLGLSADILRVDPRKATFKTYREIDWADASVLYLSSTADLAFEGQQLDIPLKGAATGPFSASGLPSGAQVDSLGAIKGNANGKVGIYTITRKSDGFSETTYLRIRAFPEKLLRNPDSPAKLVYAEHEALLWGEESGRPFGKVTLKLAASGLFSGTFTKEGAKVVPLRSRFSPDAEGTAAAATIYLSDGSTLGLTLNAEGLGAYVYQGGLQPVAQTHLGSHSGRIRLYNAANPAPGGPAKGGKPYTFRIEHNESEAPYGAGWATATINTAGTLTLKGKLGDGRTLTGSLRATSVGYLPYLTPYGKLEDAYLSGRLVLTPRGDGEYQSSGSNVQLYWSKPGAADKNDRVPGFDPIFRVGTLMPWKKITTAAEFAETFDIELDDLLRVRVLGPDEITFDRPIPSALAWSVSKGKLSTSIAAPVLVENNDKANKKEWAKYWKFSANLAKGTFSGHVILKDTVPNPTKKNPDATKVVSRKVPFNGVFIAADYRPIGYAQAVVPAINSKEPSTSIGITLNIQDPK